LARSIANSFASQNTTHSSIERSNIANTKNACEIPEHMISDEVLKKIDREIDAAEKMKADAADLRSKLPCLNGGVSKTRFERGANPSQAE
jgi:hypothetical protein